MAQCLAAPLSRMDIRRRARVIRKIAGEDNKLYFDIVKFLDVTLPKIDPEFNLVIEDKESMGDCHGLTYPDKNEIHIREDVYNRALEGSGRDRLTMAHELFHVLQHEKSNISYARAGSNHPVEKYRDPEWQADAFGGELLVPAHLVKGLSVDEIVRECGVSYKAACYQISKM